MNANNMIPPIPPEHFPPIHQEGPPRVFHHPPQRPIDIIQGSTQSIGQNAVGNGILGQMNNLNIDGHSSAKAKGGMEQGQPMQGIQPLDMSATTPSYEGWTFYRADPEMSGQKPTWSRATKTKMYLSQDELVKMVQKSKKKTTVTEQYQNLSKFKRAHVDRLIEDHKRQDNDPRFDWTCVYIKVDGKLVKKRGSLRSDYEAISMDVVIMRKLRPNIPIKAAAGASSGSKNAFGELVDLNTPSKAKDKDQNKSDNHNGSPDTRTMKGMPIDSQRFGQGFGQRVPPPGMTNTAQQQMPSPIPPHPAPSQGHIIGGQRPMATPGQQVPGPQDPPVCSHPVGMYGGIGPAGANSPVGIEMLHGGTHPRPQEPPVGGQPTGMHGGSGAAGVQNSMLNCGTQHGPQGRSVGGQPAGMHGSIDAAGAKNNPIGIEAINSGTPGPGPFHPTQRPGDTILPRTPFPNDFPKKQNKTEPPFAEPKILNSSRPAKSPKEHQTLEMDSPPETSSVEDVESELFEQDEESSATEGSYEDRHEKPQLRGSLHLQRRFSKRDHYNEPSYRAHHRKHPHRHIYYPGEGNRNRYPVGQVDLLPENSLRAHRERGKTRATDALLDRARPRVTYGDRGNYGNSILPISTEIAYIDEMIREKEREQEWERAREREKDIERALNEHMRNRELRNREERLLRRERELEYRERKFDEKVEARLMGNRVREYPSYHRYGYGSRDNYY